MKILPGELPMEGFCGRLIVGLEVEEPLFEGAERVEMVGCEGLALDDREVDFDLVQPARMDWRVYDGEVGPLAGEALLAAFAAVRGSVVDHPEHPLRRTIGPLGHHLADEPFEGADPGLVLGAAEDLSPMNIPCSQVGPGSSAPVFMFDTHGLARSSGGEGMLAAARLNAGFLVGTDDVVLRPQSLAFPHSLVEIEDTTRLVGEVGIPWEDPAAMVPWANGVFGEPA